MSKNREKMVKHILDVGEEIYNKLSPGVPFEWLVSDLTVAQLRVLLVLHTEGPSRMSYIASNIDVPLSTATGIMDSLVNKELVLRGADPNDRRLVICSLSTEGQALTDSLWATGRLQVGSLLEGLSLEQLRKVTEVADLLLGNVLGKNDRL